MRAQYQTYPRQDSQPEKFEKLEVLYSHEERQELFSYVKASLMQKHSAELCTLAITANFDPQDCFESVRLDSDYVLWRQTPASDIPGVVELGGKHWTAHKKMAPVEVIRQELVDAGFAIMSEEFELVPGNSVGTLKLLVTNA